VEEELRMTRQNDPDAETTLPQPGEDREGERERVRSSNDRDQEREEQGETPPHNRGYDKAVRGVTETQE
jgi:hypothetical protein